jgi:hypothetical protein
MLITIGRCTEGAREVLVSNYESLLQPYFARAFRIG